MRFSLTWKGRQPSSFAQVVPWLLPGDALSNDALAIAAQLASHGPVTLHCEGPVHPGLAALVTAGEPSPNASVLVHIDERVSTGTRTFERSPASFGRASQSQVARVHALAMTAAPLTGFDRVLATSTWIAGRAVDRGAQACAVVPTFLPLDALTEAGRTRSDDGPNATIVAVGPFRVGERLASSVVVDHFVRTHMNSDVRLVAIGRCLDPGTERAVSLLCNELRLGNPWRGHLGHEAYVNELASAGALLHHADATGFGSAMVEAMAAGTPVVACGGGAVAETLSGAGIHLPGDPAPTIVAEAVHAVIADGALRRQLAVAGRLRAEQLAPAACAEQLDRELHAAGWW